MSAVQIKVWHKCFEGDRESFESDPHSGRPATSRTRENVERVRAASNKDQRLTVWRQEADLGIPETAVSKILAQDLGMKCVVAKFVSQVLLPEQKEHHVAVANDLIETVTNWTRFPQEDHNQRWITGLQWWSRNKGRVIPMKVTWFSSPEEGVAASGSKVKTMFFDWEGVVHHEYASPGQRISKYCLNVRGPKVPALKGTEVSLSYIQCVLYLLQ